MASEFEGWTQAEIIEEIKRELEALAIKRTDLGAAQKRRSEVETSIREERLPLIEERFLARADRILALEGFIRETEAEISRFEERPVRRAEEIASLEASIAKIERLPYVGAVEQFIRIETIRRLRRSISALRGWQTRDAEYLDALRRTRSADVRALASMRGWQTREAPLISRLAELRDILTTALEQIASLRASIAKEEARLEIKRKLIAKELGRVSLNLYLIIETGEHEYPRNREAYYVYRKPRPRRVRVRRPYPKGAFQSWLECDAFLNPETREIIQDEEPFPTLLALMREDVAREFEEEFSLPRVDPDSLTLGEVSELPEPEEIGKPPYKLRVERTVDTKPRETWSTTVARYLMSDEDYDELTKDMKQYRAHLEAMT